MPAIVLNIEISFGTVLLYVRPQVCVTAIRDACAYQPCLNGGSCVSLGTTFECLCPDNFWGTRCETGQLLT